MLHNLQSASERITALRRRVSELEVIHLNAAWRCEVEHLECFREESPLYWGYLHHFDLIALRAFEALLAAQEALASAERDFESLLDQAECDDARGGHVPFWA